jgi:CTP:molybdopterin cytidylyltransferase MocA
VVRDVDDLDPAIGLRQLLERRPVTELAVDDPGVVADLDTPDEYERLRRGPGAGAQPR